jgi:putative Mg2+ transporter-C (MgtC) family protein
VPELSEAAHGWDMVVRLAVGTLMGIIIGLERQLRRRPAGLQTSVLVSVGATLFATIGPAVGINDLRIVANTVTGVGFLAGGVILRDGLNVTGLNTAATIWAAAAIGSLAGIGLFREALVGAIVIVVLNAAMDPVAAAIDKRLGR